MPSSTGWADLLTPIFRKVFFDQYSLDESLGDMIPRFFGQMTSSKAEEKFTAAGALGVPHRLDALGKVPYDEPRQGYDVSIDFPEYVSGFQIPRKLYDDDLYGVMTQYPGELGTMFSRRKQFYAAQVFNKANASSWTDDGINVKTVGGDSQPLLSASHTQNSGVPAVGTASTSNYSAASLGLSAANLDTVRQYMRAFTDDRGNLLGVRPDTILIPPELEKTMFEIGASPNVPGEFSNTANFMYGRFQVVVWDLLTDADLYFMIDSQRARQALHWIDRVQPEFARAEDFDTLTAKWRAYARWGYGFTDWRWIYGAQTS